MRRCGPSGPRIQGPTRRARQLRTSARRHTPRRSKRRAATGRPGTPRLRAVPPARIPAGRPGSRREVFRSKPRAQRGGKAEQHRRLPCDRHACGHRRRDAPRVLRGREPGASRDANHQAATGVLANPVPRASTHTGSALPGCSAVPAIAGTTSAAPNSTHAGGTIWDSRRAPGTIAAGHAPPFTRCRAHSKPRQRAEAAWAHRLAETRSALSTRGSRGLDQQLGAVVRTLHFSFAAACSPPCP